jgi:hypothetical protein
MKQLKTLSIALISSSVLFISCSKQMETPVQPEVVISNTISGQVFQVNEHGKLQTQLTDVQVQLEQQGKVMASVSTNSDGSYSFSQVASGTYKVIYKHASLVAVHQEVTLGNQPVRLSPITMGPIAKHTIQVKGQSLSDGYLNLDLQFNPQPFKGSPYTATMFIYKSAQSSPDKAVARITRSTEVDGWLDLISIDQLKELGFKKGEIVYLTIYPDTFQVNTQANPLNIQYPALHQSAVQHVQVRL